jgi:hypothetical protein
MQRPAQSRHVCLAFVTAAAVCVSVWLQYPAEAEDQTAPVASEPARINVYICDSQRVSITPWRQTLVRVIGRALASTRGTRSRIMGEAKCGAQAVEFACTAGVYDQGGRVLMCSPETLLQFVRVSAWYALQHSDRPGEDYESFRSRQPAPLGMAAFTAAAPAHGDSALDAKIEQLRNVMEANGGASPSQGLERLFQAILDLTFAAMFGHEASHVETRPPFCAITEPSRMEDSGLWSVLLRVSSSDELYKPSAPTPGEVAADRCASRRIRLERSVLSAGPLDAREQEFVRRTAADIISTILLTHVQDPSRRPVFRLNDSYLLPPLRMVALAGEMNAGESGPMVCGGAAENLVEASQQTYRLRPGNGVMPDEIEHAFPKGVIDAWAHGGTHSKAAFACRQD